MTAPSRPADGSGKAMAEIDRLLQVWKRAVIDNRAGDISERVVASRYAEALAAIRALGAASSAPEVTAGWKMVPIKPTPYMLDKAAEVRPYRATDSIGRPILGETSAADCWTIMLAAAPQPPTTDACAAEENWLDVEIDYTNYKGRRAVRTIRPTGRLVTDQTYHPGVPFLIEAMDVERNVMRTFDPKHIHRWGDVLLCPPTTDAAIRGTDRKPPCHFGGGNDAAVCTVCGVGYDPCRGEAKSDCGAAAYIEVLKNKLRLAKAIARHLGGATDRAGERLPGLEFARDIADYWQQRFLLLRDEAGKSLRRLNLGDRAEGAKQVLDAIKDEIKRLTPEANHG